MTEQEFRDIWNHRPAIKPQTYRVYYNESGTPVCYTTQDLPGNYLEIDVATFAMSPHKVRIKDGKLVELLANQTLKLQPNIFGTSCHPKDVAIVVGDQSPNTKWSRQWNIE